MPTVFVIHPLLVRPRTQDYGAEPELLQYLFEVGLAEPLHLDAHELPAAESYEDALLADLQGQQGFDMLRRFSDQAVSLSERTGGQGTSLVREMRAWSEFQDRQVRSGRSHHLARIPTADGVEEDGFGEWSRAAAVVLRAQLHQLVPDSDGKHLLAVMARGLKYRARAAAANLPYQSHPLRRDFTVAFDLMVEGGSNALVEGIIGSIRGIHESIAAAAAETDRIRFDWLQLNLPLLGGRLWSDSERGQVDDATWMRGVVSRIAEYRDRARDLRSAIERCVTQEDYLKLTLEVEEVKRQLLERLGLRRVELSTVERELVSSVASVIDSAPGIPDVSGLWFGARVAGKRAGFHGGRPYQRFLYREYVQAWKRSRP